MLVRLADLPDMPDVAERVKWLQFADVAANAIVQRRMVGFGVSAYDLARPSVRPTLHGIIAVARSTFRH
jgi:hypothetical protein